jgi:peptide/nickel transport system ATP-binding protein
MLEIRDLVVKYKTSKGSVSAVDRISLEIDTGTIFGLVGESGSGKTTLGLSLLRILPPNASIESGDILVSGTNITKLKEREMRNWRGKKIAMVFQGAMSSLNPLMTVEEQVAEPLIIHENMERSLANRKAKDNLANVGLGENILKRYPHELSGGMKQRVVIAMAIIGHPELLIADEPTTALDVVTQHRIMKLFKALRDEYGITIIMISHDLPIVAEVANSMAIMYGGKISEVGKAREVVTKSKHPYTQGLIKSIPNPKSSEVIRGIPGEPVSLVNPSPGCRFYDRCSFRRDICKTYDYNPAVLDGQHKVYCNLYEVGKQ